MLLAGRDRLYATRRVGSDFRYALPVANGRYTLKLYFADPVYTTAGKRLFNVSAEGKAVITNYKSTAYYGNPLVGFP